MRYKIINRKKLFATMLFDGLGSMLFALFNRLRLPQSPEQPIKKILIVRTAYVGDVVMTLPIIKPLKLRFPEAKISFVTSKDSADLLEGNPYIDTIYRFNPFWFYNSPIKEYLNFIKLIRKEKFDLVIEARCDIREILFIISLVKSKIKLSYGFGGGAYLLTHVVPFNRIKHRIEYHLDLVRYLGCRTDIIDFTIHLKEQEKFKIRRILEENGICGPFIAAHPGARLPLKCWPIKKCAELYDRIIKEFKLPLVILGQKKNDEIANSIAKKMNSPVIKLVGCLNLRELAALISRARLFVCNDSAPMHIASAMKIPTVAIFGPSKSIETRPYFTDHRVIEKYFPCRYSCDESSCRYYIHNGCMEAITVDDVFNCVKDLM